MQKSAWPIIQKKIAWILVITHIANNELQSCFQKVALFPRKTSEEKLSDLRFSPCSAT